MKKIFGLAIVMLMTTGMALGQTLITGDLTGRIIDSTGAAVAGATVTLTSLEDGSVKTVTTNREGEYRFALLRPGFYKVHEEGAGLSAEAGRVAVNVGQASTVDLVASPTGNATTIDVTSGEPLLQKEDANISSTFSTQQIEDLPIPGGDISNLPFSTPGASLSTGDGYGNFTVFGLPSTSNLYTTNGSDLMDAFLNLPNSGASNNVLGANELQETAVVVNGYTGQYGHLAGAQVNFTTKSGTNKFHGNANYYYNGTALNANDWFLKEYAAQDTAAGTPTPNQAPHAVSNQWSYSIGGPIWKDKLFFYFDDEGLRYVLPGGGSTIYLPSSAFQTAVLSNIATKQPAELAFYKNIFALYSGANGFSSAQPTFGAANDPNGDGGCGDFAGTTIGGKTFGGAAGDTPCAVFYSPNNNNFNKEQLYSFRIDANLTSKDQLNGRYKHDFGVQATSTDPINPVFSANSGQPEYDAQLNETHIFSSNIVNSATIASLYYSAEFGPPALGAALATFPTTFGFTDGYGFANLGGSDSSYPSGRNVSQYQVTDDLSITKGINSIKVGFNFRRFNITDFAPLAGTSGSTTFTSNTDFVNGVISSANASGTSTTTVDYPSIGAGHFALYTFAAYLQDQAAISKNFKLTASLRFDRSGNPKCNGSCFVRLAGTFANIAHGATIPYNQSILTGQGNAFSGVEPVTVQPRVGFAWTPPGRENTTVIRGGIGLFADIPVADVLGRFLTAAPNYNAFTLTPATGVSYTVDPALATSSYTSLNASNKAFVSGFSSGQTLAQIQAAVAATGSSYSAPNYSAAAPDKLQNAKFVEYNLEVQRTLDKHDVLSINYVGNFGYDILFANPTVNAYAYCLTTGTCPGGYPGLPAAQPDTRFKAVTQLTNFGHSNYNGLVTSFRHQSSHGLTATVNYTYSHSLDNTSNGGIEGYSVGSESTHVLTQIDPNSVDRLNYGNSDYDNRHNLSLNYVWAIPYKFHNVIEKTALEGWSFSGTLFDKSGTPFTVIRGSVASTYTNSTNGGSTLGGYLGSGKAQTAPCGRPSNVCLLSSNYASKSKQYLYGFGNQARNSYFGPMYFDTDLQLAKTTNIGERVKFKFGANFFNILNHPNFDNPNSNLALGSFGTITADLPPVSSPYGNFQGAGVSGRIVQVLGGITF